MIEYDKSINNMNGNVLSLLREVQALIDINNEKQHQAFLRGEEYNIFEILRMDASEVRLHSAILGNLLNPNASHALDDKLLAEFLKVLPVTIPEIEYSSATVQLEECHGPISDDGMRGGNIDIVIHFSNYHILIENKIFASDQESQIMRYHNEYKNKPHLLLYLTLDGHEPSEKSSRGLESEKDFFIISYSNHILKWLDECKKITFDKPLVRETIKQYYNTIRKLTNQLMDNQDRENLFKQMDEYPDAVNAIVKEQWYYRLHLVEKFIIAPLKEWCKNNGLEWYEDSNFRNQSKKQGFGIYRHGWTKMIAAEFQNCDFSELSYGVRDPKGRGHGKKLLGDNANENWPYGWKKNGIVRNWQLSNAQDIIKGKVVKELIKIFEDLLLKIEAEPDKFPMD